MSSYQILKMSRRYESKEYDFAIVGAGPAGMFAAFKMLEANGSLKICIIDRGARAEKRKRDDVMIGFGGAGTYSDGKLIYTPNLSHKKPSHLITESGYVELIEYVDKLLTDYGVNEPYFPKRSKRVQKLVEEAQRRDIRLYIRKARHVGSDKLEKIVIKIQKHFEGKGIDVIDKTEVVDLIVKNKECKGVLTKEGKKILTKNVLVAPGRIGSLWLQELCKKYKVDYVYDKVEVGVRVEFPEAVMREHSDLMYESVFEMRTRSFDDTIRTFCHCPNGKVAKEDYKGYVCVNGHTTSKQDSENSNLAFVTEIELTEPVENTTLYAQSIAELATTLGGGKPIVQRLADFKKGRRSTTKRIMNNYVVPTLKEATPGDISMALPHRIATNILEGLVKLDAVLPGINNDSTLLYAPEVKYRGSKIKTNENLETSLQGLYVAGDGAGLSGNIIGAAVTGVMAANGLINTLKK